jgi:hypothetical protein
MSRSLILAAVFVSSACAAIWPPKLGQYEVKSVASAPAENQPLAEEYGFVAGERADYGSFQVAADEFKDATGAYAAALDVSGKGAIRVGNYLVSCQGKCPKNLAALADAGLPHVSQGSLPTLGEYFPARNLLPRSERYVVGPVGLAAVAPEIPAAAVLFDFGTEAELARYRTPGGPVTLLVFSFATPSLARQQLPQFEKITAASTKRTGPLIAVAMGPPVACARLLDTVNYQGVVASNEPPPVKPLELKPQSAGQMVLAILSLAGLLLAFCLLSGIAVGGTLRIARRFGYQGAEGSMITLHLEGK